MREWLKRSGVLLALTGAAGSGAWKAAGHGWKWLSSKAMTTVEIDINNLLYDVVRVYIDSLPVSQNGHRFTGMLAEDSAPRHPGCNSQSHPEPVSRSEVKWDKPQRRAKLSPNAPLRSFWFEGHLIMVRFVTHKPQHRGEQARYTMEISTVGRNRNIGRRLIEKAVEEAQKGSEHRTTICVSRRRDWQVVADRPMRAASSVILDQGMMEDFLQDARRFLADRDWYGQMGIPHRRGYLFHGPPGTGKTSLAQVLAGELGLPIYILRLSGDLMTDDIAESLMREAPTECVLLLEDIDAAFKQREYQGMKQRGGGMTFSGLLNLLDGVCAKEGRLIIMTTNHPHLLDRALRRPGRIDREYHIGYATEDQKKRLYQWFFPVAEENWADQFAQALADLQVTPARVVQYLLIHRDDAFLALANRDQFMAMTHDAESEIPTEAEDQGEMASSGSQDVQGVQSAGSPEVAEASRHCVWCGRHPDDYDDRDYPDDYGVGGQSPTPGICHEAVDDDDDEDSRWP